MPCALIGRAGGFGGGERAFTASADAAQVFPRVDAARVAVCPVKLQRIAAHGVSAGWLGRWSVHGKDSGGLRLGLAGFAAFQLALFNAGGAGTCLAKPGEAPRAAVAVYPIDFHALALPEQHTDFFRGDGDARKRAVCFRLANFLVL